MSQVGRCKIAAIMALAFLMVQFRVWAAPPQELRGIVKDRSGAVIAKAQVLLRVDGQEISRTTQADGSFVFTGITAASGSVVVSASGFATSHYSVASGSEPTLHNARAGTGAAESRRDGDPHFHPAHRRG